LSKTFPGSHEHLVRRLVRQLASNDATRERLNARRVPVIQPLEGPRVSRRRASHVGGVGIVGRSRAHGGHPRRAARSRARIM
jgi:hypothetical protein